MQPSTGATGARTGEFAGARHERLHAGQAHASAEPTTGQPRQAQPASPAAAIARSPRMVAQKQAIRTVFGPHAAQAQQQMDADQQLPGEVSAPATVTQCAAADDDAANLTGMPAPLKSGIEAMSGLDMSDVRVHRNSDKPAQLNAQACAQGNEIHLGPGQERHLAHEAWHVVQQKQGRVEATMQMAGTAAATQAVAQRAGVFTVNHYDYNPDTQHFSNQVIQNARFGPALVEFVNANLRQIAPEVDSRRQEQVQSQLRTRMSSDAGNYANWVDTAANDVEALADAVVAHLLRNPGAGNLVQAVLRPGVVNALVYGLPTRASDSGAAAEERSKLTANEITAFEQLIGVCATTSRAKGTSNTVAVGDLGAVEGLSGAYAAVRQTILDKNEALLPRLGNEYDLLTTNALGGEAGAGMAIRSMHLSGAGWLPPGAIALPTTLAALRAQVDAAYALTYSGARQTAIESLPAAVQDKTRAAIRRTKVQDVIGPLPRRTKLLLIWGSYAESAGGLMNYVEFNLGSRISRLMYDYANGAFYITAHYNWFKGYNPFFQVTGSSD